MSRNRMLRAWAVLFSLLRVVGGSPSPEARGAQDPSKFTSTNARRIARGDFALETGNRLRI